MAFVNLPPNLQDMFYSITDRVAKLETGPNQAMYTAESAQSMALYSQSVASNAQIQAISAGIQANSAASQATIAQSQATLASTLAAAASSQATSAQSSAAIAQTTANGKNTVRYSTVTPGSTANVVGDIWYQYGTSGTYANKVIAQWSGAGGTSWTSVTVSGLVIANIDAGTITTGIMNAIEINAGSGGTAFHVSPSGYMSAQGVYVRGNITADSGTFTGTIQAGTGYFGDYAGGNYWSIGSTGITGVGTAAITGGSISGSTINIGAGTFQVNSSGAITATSGVIGGWTISSTALYTGTAFINSSTGSATFTSVLANTSVTGDTINASTQFNAYASATFGSNTTTPFYYFASSGTLRSLYTYGVVRSTGVRTMLIDSAGNFGTAASTRRLKHDIESYKIDSNALLQLGVKKFKYNLDIDEDQTIQYGFIAEDAQDLGLHELIQLDAQGIPDYFAYDKLPIFLLQLAQEMDARLKLLEG